MAKRAKNKKRTSGITPATQIPAKRIRLPANGKLFPLQVTIIVAAVLWIFWPALHGDWLWDDGLYLTNNPLLHDPNRLWKIWFAPGSFIEYYPLEETVQWVQWQLWQNETFGYHLTNVILHIGNALLVWRLFNKFGLRFAWLAGLIFAIHPAMVESVAWIVELKNTLSLMPFLWAMCAWIDYEEHERRRDYLLALGLFLVAMLCKISMAPFPVVILLYAWWKRGRIGWVELKASLPFFVISLVLGFATLWAGERWVQGFMETPEVVPMGGFFSRLALAGLSLAFYFSRCFWPLGLLPVYPKWTVDPSQPLQFLPWVLLAGVLFWLWRKRHDWGRHALLGIGFFLIQLLPFVGFIVTSFMSFTWVMDHFLYIPIIGLLGLVVAGMEQVAKKLSTSVRRFAIGIVTIIMGLMAWESHGYAGIFTSQETLWTYTLQYNPEAWPGYVNLGNVLEARGQITEAVTQYEKALIIDPRYARGDYNIGCVLMKVDRVSEAIAHYEKALKINPNFPMARYNLGNALVQENRFPEAIEQFEQAEKLSPGMGLAYNNMGNALVHMNRIPEAIEQFEQAVKLGSGIAGMHDNLGNALAMENRIPEAIEQYEISLKINPNNINVRNQLVRLQGLQQTIPEAGTSAR